MTRNKGPGASGVQLDYDAKAYPPFAVTVDLLVFTIRAEGFSLLLVRRGQEPYKDRWALPGGFVREDEDLDAAARRELREEAGIEVSELEQLGAYGAPRRDPRMRVVTVAYLAFGPDLPTPAGGTDAAEARFWQVAVLEADDSLLAFDHAQIVADGVEWVREKIESSSLATDFCGEEFTVAQLRAVYEAVWGTPLDPANFQRKILTADGVLMPTGKTSPTGGRPGQLYRQGPTTAIVPPLRRTAVRTQCVTENLNPLSEGH